jgi:Flp pilus assembly protein TadD
MAWDVQGHWPEAAEAFREAVAKNGNSAIAHSNLGGALAAMRQFPEAEVHCRKAIALESGLAMGYCNLGMALLGQGRPADAEQALAQAIHLQPKICEAHNNLGNALQDQGKLPAAEAAYERAIAIHDNALTRFNLGNVLYKQVKFAQAEAAYRVATRLNPNDARAFNNLGGSLLKQGKLADAEEVLRKAIELQPGYANSHVGLARALKGQRKFKEALAIMQKASALSNAYTRDLAGYQRLADLDAKLQQIRKGEAPSATPTEQLELARFCQKYDRAYATAAGLYERAFAAQPELARDVERQYRYDASCCAALAGCGLGDDAGKLDEQERTRLRQQASGWLRADLAMYRQLLDKAPDKFRPVVRKNTEHWQKDTDFAGVRGEGLEKLPRGEREAWRELWAEVQDLLTRAGGNVPAKKK